MLWLGGLMKCQVAVSILAGAGIAVVAGSAAAQVKATKESVVGVWKFTYVTVQRPDNTTGEPWTAKPNGVFILSANGRFAIQVMRPDLPKFASNNRLQGTPDENQKVVQGSLAYFGTYTLDAGGASLSFRIEGSSFPNWTGEVQKRIISSISATQMVIENPTGSAGGQARITLTKIE
jgi:hypothetical protein